MDRIESWLTERQIMPALYLVFTTAEFGIVLSFILKKFPKWYYLLSFYAIRFALAWIAGTLPEILNTLYPVLFHITIPLIDQLIECRKVPEQKFS